MLPSCDIVFVYVKQPNNTNNNNNNKINEFGCIVLNSINSNEIRSFSVDFTLQNEATFEDESSQIFSLLNQRIWICINSDLTIQLIGNAFQHIGKTAPHCVSCVDVGSIYSQHLPHIVNNENNTEKILFNMSNHFKLPIQQCSTSKGVCELMKISLEKIGMNLLLQQYIANENQSLLPKEQFQQKQAYNDNQDTFAPNHSNDIIPADNDDINDAHGHPSHRHHVQNHRHGHGAGAVDSSTTFTQGHQHQQFQHHDNQQHSHLHQQAVNEHNANDDNNINALNEEHQQKFEQPNDNIDNDNNNFDQNQQQAQQQYYNNDNNNNNTYNENEALSQPLASPSQNLLNEEQQYNDQNVNNQQHHYQSYQHQQQKLSHSTPSSWAILAKQDKNAAGVTPTRTSNVRIITRMPNKPKNNNNNRVGKKKPFANKTFQNTNRNNNNNSPTNNNANNDNKKIPKNFKPFEPTRDLSKIKQIIGDAINDKRRIWISYNGHLKPRIPRGILPLRWDDATLSANKPREMIFYAVPYKSQSGIAQKFYLRHVEEVRDGPWSIDEAPTNDANNNTNSDKKLRSQNGNDNNNNDNNNNTTISAASKSKEKTGSSQQKNSNSNVNANANNKNKNKPKSNTIGDNSKNINSNDTTQNTTTVKSQ